ncbi:MAG: RuvX/YqgF family protein [Patescibacteria group bacterium]
MARTLGIDYGLRRVGLALSDEREFMAFPYGVLDIGKLTPEEIIRQIGDICKKEEVKEIVVGVPRGLSSMQDTEMTDHALRFIDILKVLQIPVKPTEEFLSSKEASRGPTPKERIDASAAALILQSFLDGKRNMIK